MLAYSFSLADFVHAPIDRMRSLDLASRYRTVETLHRFVIGDKAPTMASFLHLLVLVLRERSAYHQAPVLYSFSNPLHLFCALHEFAVISNIPVKFCFLFVSLSASHADFAKLTSPAVTCTLLIAA